MPCNDTYPRESNSDLELIKRNELLNNANKRNIELTAMLCALTTEVSKLGNAEDIYTKAEANGQIDIRSFIDEHKKEDEDRLKKKLENFSEHELSMIKSILNKDERF